jgi:polyketide biosynthesis enoyl-CoA hydratase PksI
MNGSGISVRVKGKTAEVSLEDRASRNTFTKGFVGELKDAFREIDANTSLHSVVVHGYDTFFCCGGSQEELLRLREAIGRDDGTFADLGFCDIFLACRIPVIAALQGHAIGGGLALALFADIMILGEECVYRANFMSYGFTPGMGITLTLPMKLGSFLGNEMLYSARSFRGADLRACGVPVRIVPRKHVVDLAFQIAEELEAVPRPALILLKDNQTRDLKDRLPSTVAAEVEMHRRTFVQPEVLTNIMSRF